MNQMPKYGSPEAQEMIDNMETWGYFEWMSNDPGAPLHHIPIWGDPLKSLPSMCDYSYTPTIEHPEAGGGMFEMLVAGVKIKNPRGGEFWLEKLPTYISYKERVKELQKLHDDYRRANRGFQELPSQV